VLAYQFATAFVVIVTAASAISTFFPALGVLVHGRIRMEDLHHIDGTYGYFFLEAIHVVRKDTHHVITVQKAAGL
jgi:hypothetical protein